MPMKIMHYFILNPKSGKGKHSDQLEQSITSVCNEKGIDYKIHRTTGIGDATVFVKGICSDPENLPARFYACGGDGTLGEVVNGAVGTDGASVGVIPVGTGNDFIRNFGSKEDFFDIAAQIEGEPASIDLIKCNDIYSVNMVNIGFDCEVVKRTVKLKKNPLVPSKLAYIVGVVTTLIKKPGLSVDLSFDGKSFEHKEFLLTTFANGPFCGGGFHSNPHASLSDGKIDILFINNVSRMKFISLVGSYKKGTHLIPKNEKIIQNQKAEKIYLRFASTQSASVDGELIDFDELCFESVRGAISFIVPKNLLPAKSFGAELESASV